MKTMDEFRNEIERMKLREMVYGSPKPNPKLTRHAAARSALHRGHSTQRILAKDYELVGLAGEQAFCDWANIEPDLSLKPKGNGGYQHRVNGRKVAIKTYRKPNNLLVEEGKVRADIYVLALYRDATQDATLLGWATKDEVLAREPYDVGGMGVVSHAIHHTALHEMDDLRGVLGIVAGVGETIPLFDLGEIA